MRLTIAAFTVSNTQLQRMSTPFVCPLHQSVRLVRRHVLSDVQVDGDDEILGCAELLAREGWCGVGGVGGGWGSVEGWCELPDMWGW